MKKKILFIDRDGTIIHEPPMTHQVDTLEQMVFLPNVIRMLHKIQQEFDFELVMVTNQDGLGTSVYPQQNFDAVQNKMLEILANEGVHFKAIHIDTSFEYEQKNTRKPGVGMLASYFSDEYDLQQSYVIGDRLTDVQLAKNLNAGAILIAELIEQQIGEEGCFRTSNWIEIYNFLKSKNRIVQFSRETNETNISLRLNLDGNGVYQVSTGLRFLDHMLEQLSKHSSIDIALSANGDLDIDEHHTVEDIAIALGQAFNNALGKKMGIERYGFCLPMDDALAQVAIDFGGRNWIEWSAEFKREKIGDVPTELFYHFFKSFSDGARCNINIKAEGTNEHHKIEAIFKAFARAIKMAIRIDRENMSLPTTKGML